RKRCNRRRSLESADSHPRVPGIRSSPRAQDCPRSCFRVSRLLESALRPAKGLPGQAPQSYRRCVAVRLTILGSGSAGNCAYLETGETRLLIDAGFSGRQIRQRLAAIGRAPEGIHGILLTHEHSDHSQGLASLCAKMRIPIYCNRLTQEAIESQLEARFDGRIFATGTTF